MLPPIFVGSVFCFYSNSSTQIWAPKSIPLDNDKWDPLVILSSSFFFLLPLDRWIWPRCPEQETAVAPEQEMPAPPLPLPLPTILLDPSALPRAGDVGTAPAHEPA